MPRLNMTETAPVANRFFAHLTTTGNGPRNLNPNIVANGYGPWLDEVLPPTLEFGALNGMVHNPGGNDWGPMDADQIPALLESNDARLHRLGEEWPQAAKRYAAAYPQGLAVAYFGKLLEDSSFDGPIADGRPAVALRRLVGSYFDAIDAGLGVAFDALGKLRNDSWQAAFVELLRRLGVPVCVEPLPGAGGAELYPWAYLPDVLVVCKESFYQRNKLGTGPNKTLPASEVHGPIVRFAHSDEAERRGLVWGAMSSKDRGLLVLDVCVKALAEGDCALASVQHLRNAGVDTMAGLTALVLEREAALT